MPSKTWFNQLCSSRKKLLNIGVSEIL